MASKSAAELRRFGLTVGGVFGLLAAVSWWRNHVYPPVVLGSLAVLLMVPGLVAPLVLGPVERAWMAFAHVLGAVNARIILTVLFYLVIFPIGVIRRLFGDPLDRSLTDGRTSNWVRRPTGPVERARYEQQF